MVRGLRTALAALLLAGIASTAFASLSKAPGHDYVMQSPAHALANGRAAQLDICAGSVATSMQLDVAEGVCTVTTRILPTANATGSTAGPVVILSHDGPSALQFSFPCAPSALQPQRSEGPALNLWASAAPAAAAAASAANASSAASAPDACVLTTLNPVMYFRRDGLPLYYYGYNVSGLSCKELPSFSSLGAGRTRSAPVATITYGIFLVPELPTPSEAVGSHRSAKFFSTAAQSCRLVVTAAGKTHQSKGLYPCNLVEDPEASLGKGACFGSGPGPVRAGANTRAVPAGEGHARSTAAGGGGAAHNHGHGHGAAGAAAAGGGAAHGHSRSAAPSAGGAAHSHSHGHSNGAAGAAGHAGGAAHGNGHGASGAAQQRKPKPAAGGNGQHGSSGHGNGRRAPGQQHQSRQQQKQ